MKPRTSHTLGGMRRYIQMSRDQVFIFVEGRDLDPDIYSRICAPVCKGAGKTYELIVADRVSGDGGGKNILTRLFEHLRDNHALVDRSGQDSKLVMFYLDKDVDDIFHTLRSSDHVVYTRYYSIENHLFCEGELLPSAATAGSIDSEWIRTRLTDSGAWRGEAARRWRDWISLCLVARKLRLPGPVSYAVKQAAMSPPAESLADAATLAAVTSSMQTRSGLSVDRFGKILAAAYRLTDTTFKRSQHDLVFKGKWYTFFVLRELEAASAGRPYNRKGAEDRLIGSLISSIDFDSLWAEHFRQPLRVALRSF